MNLIYLSNCETIKFIFNLLYRTQETNIIMEYHYFMLPPLILVQCFQNLGSILSGQSVFREKFVPYFTNTLSPWATNIHMSTLTKKVSLCVQGFKRFSIVKDTKIVKDKCVLTIKNTRNGTTPPGSSSPK